MLVCKWLSKTFFKVAYFNKWASLIQLKRYKLSMCESKTEAVLN